MAIVIGYRWGIDAIVAFRVDCVGYIQKFIDMTLNDSEFNVPIRFIGEYNIHKELNNDLNVTFDVVCSHQLAISFYSLVATNHVSR